MFFVRTIDSIIADIQQKIERLHIVAEAKHAEAEVHDAVAAERIRAATEARAIRDRAKAIATKFSNLISEEV